VALSNGYVANDLGWPLSTLNHLNFYILHCLMHPRNWRSQILLIWCRWWMCKSQPTDDKLTHYKILGGSNHITFRGILSSVRFPAAKKWRATPNVKIFVLSHPLGDLGVTYTVQLWLVGKRVVDFLLALNELFSPAFTVEALWANIGRNCDVWKRGGSLSAQVSGGRGVVDQWILASEN